MRTTAIITFALFILTLVAGVAAVKWVPHLEHQWREAGAELTPAQATLVRVGHQCQTGCGLLLPASLSLGVASVALFVISGKPKRREPTRRAREHSAAG